MQFTLAIDGKYLTISSTQKVIREAFPVDKYMFKVKKRSTRKRWEIYSKFIKNDTKKKTWM